jgi:hypothetical protein
MQQETDSLVVRPALTFRWLAPLGAAAMAGLFAWIAVFPQTGITAFDRTIAAIGAMFFLSSIVEYSQKRYVFTPHEIHGWWWFSWHVIPIQHSIGVGTNKWTRETFIFDIETESLLLKIPKDFWNQGALEQSVRSFYRRFGRLAPA